MTPRRVLVTGGSKGIGRAVAESFAAEGADVVVGYHSDQAAAEETCARLAELGGHGIARHGDISTEPGAQQLVRAAQAATGGLDVLVHCAVHAARGDLLTSDSDDVATAVSGNGLSLLWLARTAAPLMPPGGSIVLLTSQGARTVIPGYGLIGPPKALAESLATYLAVELAPREIRVNIVESGPVDTHSFRRAVGAADQALASAQRRTPLGRLVAAADVGRLVRQLSTDTFGMVTGQRLVVDGGLTLRG